MIYEIVTGSAFQVDEPMDGNVRNYTASDGTHWVGHETYDVIYACRADCLLSLLVDCGVPLEGSVARSHVRLETARIVHFDHAGMRPNDEVHADTVEWHRHDDCWPDYTVACGNCGEILHEGSEE